MFLRRTNFEDLQRMVVSCISDGSDQLALSAERRKIEAWPSHYEAYVGVMAESGHMADGVAGETKLVAVESELSRTRARYIRLAGEREERFNQLNAKRARTKQLADEEEHQFVARAKMLREDEEKAQRDAQSLESSVAALDK